MSRSKTISIIVSIVAAIGLWLFVVSVVNPSDEIALSDVAVEFSGEEVLREDQNLIVMPIDTAVRLEVSGRSSDLAALRRDREQLTAVVDVTKIRSAKEYALTYNLNLPSSVQGAELSFTRRPLEVRVNVERLLSREIEIHGDFSAMQIADGYMLDSTSFDYDTVTVEGPESVVSAIKEARVVLERSQLDKSFSEQIAYTLVDENGNAVDNAYLTTDINSVEVAVNIVMYKEVPLALEFIDGGGAKDSDVTMEIEPTTITLSGDPSLLEAVNKINLGNVDLSNTPNSAERVFPIIIPDGAKCVSGEEEATVTIRVKNKATSVIRATNIAFVNLAEGLQANSLTQLVQTTVRASTADIASITANNLRVVADMEQITKPGRTTVPVEIYIDGYPEAGVIGEYTIVVSVTEAE